ncbi:MAG: nickel-dependent lactate racemase [Clostridia bacterium]|nr:nickel-dependent lactate racemase [Clostridia bacterium]
MIKNYMFEYGETTVSVPVDESDVIGELKGKKIPTIADEDLCAVLYETLDHPIGALPLCDSIKPNMKVALVVSDITRFWMRQDKVIPHLINYLLDTCHVQVENITIVIATGTHRGGDEAEMRMIVTDHVYDTVKVENHDCQAPDLVYIGTTDYDNAILVNHTVATADYVICLGAATHHVMAGYGGGRKSILPGVSGIATIMRNHALSLDPKQFATNPAIGCGKLKGNPIHEDMVQAASFLKNLFMVNLVCNAEMELSYIFSGHFVKAWEKACDIVDEIYRLPIKEKADVIVASCGGYPKDESLYQGTKTVDNIISGIKDGGTLVLLMEARNGGGSPDYFDWSRYLVHGGFEETLRNHFTVGGYIFFLNCEQAKKINIYLYTKAADKEIPLMGIHVYHDMDKLLADAKISGKKTYIVPNGATVIPVLEEKENA